MLNKSYNNSILPRGVIYLIAITVLTFHVSATEVLTEKNSVPHDRRAVIEVSGSATVTLLPEPFSADIILLEKGTYAQKVQALVEYKTDLIKSISHSTAKSQAGFNVSELHLQILPRDKKSIDIHGLILPILISQQLISQKKSVQKVAALKNSANQSSEKISEFLISTNGINENSTSINTISNSSRNKASINQKVELVHVASRKISVKFTNQKDYQQFIDKMIKVGVYSVNPTPLAEQEFSLHYQTGLSRAVADAKNKAKQMLTALESDEVILHSLKETSDKQKQYDDYLRNVQNNASISANGYQQVTLINPPSTFGKYSIHIAVKVQFMLEQ